MKIKISDIIDKIGCKQLFGDKDSIITIVKQFDDKNTNPEALMWVNAKNAHKLNNVEYGVIICGEVEIKQKKGCSYIIVENPRRYFMKVLELFFAYSIKPSISSSAKISNNVIIGNDVFIGENVVIEDGCIVGDNSIILHNTIIFGNTIIGKHVKIGSNNTIGNVGFGYEKDESGEYCLIPHIGNVIIEDHVEIGNNSCIDRAVMGSTLIKKHAKIDNLVHVAHGVVIGENSLIIANTMIGGSTNIGDNCWVAPSTSLINKIQIGKNAVIGMGAVVIKDVAENTTVVGNPAKPLIKKTK